MDRRLTIGDWVIDPDRNLLIRGNKSVTVEQKAMDVLLFLVRHEGRVATRDAILDEVWEETYVTEESLTRCISLLRKALDDHPSRPAYIKTIKGKGYELIAPVSRPEQKASTASSPPARQSFPVPVWAIVSGLLILFLILGFLPNILSSTDDSGDSVHPWIKRPLTTQIGEEKYPAVSPDGSRFAYAAYDPATGSRNIYTRVTGAGEPLLLTGHASDEIAPAWSPDGRHLAFVRLDESGSGSSIWIAPSLGGPESRLVSRSIAGYPELSWSPDGTRIAYTDRAGPEASNAIFEVNINTGDTTRLTRATAQHWGDHTPSYAPDGVWLTYIASVSAGTHAIFRLNRTNGNTEQVTPVPLRIAGQTWAPDGSSLYYVTDLPEVRSIWSIDPNSPAEARWTGISGGHPSVDSNGRVLVEQTRTVKNLFESEITGEENHFLRTAAFNSTGSDRSPALSPGGKRLAFLSDRSGHTELWMYDYESSSLKQLTRFEGSRYLQSPSWAPDTTTIAFTAFSPESHADVWVTDISGTPPRPLIKTPLMSNELAPSWCPGGQSLVVGSNRTGKWQIWNYDIVKASWTQLTRNGGYAAQCGPDGTIYLTKYDRAGIWKYSPETDEEELLIENFTGLLPHTWHLFHEGVFYAGGSGPENIGYYPFADSRNFPVFEATGKNVEEITYSPDTRKLVVAVTENRESDIYLYSRGE